jgi:hypothetical protein
MSQLYVFPYNFCVLLSFWLAGDVLRLSCRIPLWQAPRLFQDGRLPITRETRDKVVSGIPGLPPLWAMDLPSPVLETGASFSSMQTRYSHIRRADVIVLNTCCALEKAVLDARSRDEGVGTPDLQVGLIVKFSVLWLFFEFLGFSFQADFNFLTG